MAFLPRQGRVYKQIKSLIDLLSPRARGGNLTLVAGVSLPHSLPRSLSTGINLLGKEKLLDAVILEDIVQGRGDHLLLHGG